MRTASIAIFAGLLAAAGCGGRGSGTTDPANELPMGVVDAPAEGAELPPQTPVAGWALDDRGIKEIRIYVDQHFVTAASITVDRPDVSKALPAYARGSDRHGWTTAVTFEKPGLHTILVQAVDSDGATRDIGVKHVASRDK